MVKKVVEAKSIKYLLKQTFESSDNIQVKYIVGKVSKNVVEFVKETMNINIENYVHVIDNYAVKHSILKHGNATSEAKRGQIAITLDYFEKIVDVLKNPDFIKDSGKNKIGQPTLLYQKTINNTIIYVEEIRTGKKELAMNTMYIKKLIKK